jgi:hypothetical protein
MREYIFAYTVIYDVAIFYMYRNIYQSNLTQAVNLANRVFSGLNFEP